jgi:Tol biopolymer transport system component
MPNLSDLLERESRTVGLKPDFERLVRRRDRKRRNQRLTAGVVAVAVFVGAMWFLAGRFSDRTPTPASRPLPAGLGSLAYGVDGDIYVAELDGSNPVRIADGRPPNECGAPGDYSLGEYWGEGPMWSPDGRYLAYRRANCEVPGDLRWHVVISDPEGNVVAEFPGDGWDISWSPDSTRVAVWVNLFEGTIGVFGVDGERQALLTVPREMRSAGDYDPVWLPDGESLVVPDVVVPIDGSTPYKLPLADRRPEYASVTYSPDGSRVAYVADRSLVVAEVDGSNPQVVFGDWVWRPVWSPAGDRIAFISRNFHQLRVLDMETGTVTLLAEAGGSDQLEVIDFSPEGDRILFARREDGRIGVGSLWSVNADGSDAPRRLVAVTSWGDWLSPGPTR